ncbi:CinA family nicotinamide mononucleotide deamidase-related protein [Blastopirellula sp. JC732]|uniref:CinA-like protein n=1 Tax=Blastopirellula sediminis TaxID=2894196 RepID=A0A9X1MIP6_9BACT|nr:CinA family nicotinamide mononucleotide deamidase-related protein [Blastopirellula sediminis]MCC9608190.1 CinA family nicotinamide mononucleotide deamidase-related protein [Blastopirellula sediminis]MCC9627017.1 CinA family nicotinamide mononucleotide deamidase-related protein [Blastopirellula sediminis]
MRAEIVAIGDELTSGQRLDTNSQWLSQELGNLGIAVGFHTTAADELDSLVDCLKIAADRADIVVVSGGLGPTADDLTREAFSLAFDRPLELDPESLAHIERRFASRGVTMPERNRVQAMFPAGCQVVPNPNGTAPGIDLTLERNGRTVRLFALPGVPIELKEMWTQTVKGAIGGTSAAPANLIRHYELKCFGVGESRLEEMLPDMIRRGREPQVGITVHQATITLRVTTNGKDDVECLAQAQPTLDEIRTILGPLVFGETGDELQDAVGRMLTAAGQTVACCESATAGLIALSLTESPAANASFAGGRITPSLQALSVYAGEASVGETAVVEQAASKVREEFGTDYGLAIGPIDESGAYSFAVADAKGVVSESSQTLGHPEIHRPRAAKQVLDLLRRRMMS